MVSPIQHRQRLLNELDRLERLIAEGDPSGELRLERADLLARLGRDTDAKEAYIALLAVMPSHFRLLNNLGTLLDGLGYTSAARTLYREAVKHHPGHPTGLINLGTSLQKAREFEEARTHFAAALALDPDSIEANRGMAYTLAGQGDEAAARPYREKGFRQRPTLIRPYRGDAAPIELLVLSSSAGGAVPILQHVDDRLFATTVLFVDFADPTVPLPPHRLIFNAIGDADLAAAALQDASALAARSTAPVINRPEAVRVTGRADNAERLAGIRGLITPKMAMLPRTSLSNAAAMLAGRGIAFPCLLRSPGFHTGHHFVRVERPEDLAAAAAELPGEVLIAIEYLDASGTDGKIRKYRVMMIDHALYPLHAAVSHDWKVHYFTADMAENAAHRSEDERFITAMEEVLTQDQRRTLADIEKALGLDYGGIDFGIDRAGNLLLFEANATMVVNPVDSDPRWTYRRAPVQQVMDAIHALLHDRAAQGTS
ncbi:tetratricopeptide repeat protein [Rhodanobacter hydrolyticus]|uniref:Tetratricopeptide repeat protein n=1 Tax=Rhodanobacter hydrolyticus TaxID=2250595 RepID=A0ABW8J7B6_9GAMM